MTSYERQMLKHHTLWPAQAQPCLWTVLGQSCGGQLCGRSGCPRPGPTCCGMDGSPGHPPTARCGPDACTGGPPAPCSTGCRGPACCGTGIGSGAASTGAPNGTARVSNDFALRFFRRYRG